MNNTPTKIPNPQNGQQRPTQGQQRPAQGQQRPMQGQQRPAQGQQRPAQGQQRPSQGQQRPMQGQQRPMQGQQRPMQGQQRPAQGQQRPAQGQQRPMQGQQRPAQGQQRRPADNGKLDMGFLMKIILVATSIILVLAILITCVALAVNGTFEDMWDNLFDRGGSSQSGGDGGGDDGPSKAPSGDKEKDDKTVVPSTLTLPSVTASGTYLSGKSSSYKTVSGISSKAAALVDMSSNQMIAGLSDDVKIYPASMTKVMTLLVACENAQNAGKLLTVTQEMINYQSSNDASGHMGFVAGDQISVEDALYLINYNSDTVACLLIANYVSGSEAEFVKLMNAKAKAIGLTKTNFVNTTGLHDPNHYTTCREMAAIMSCAMANPVARKILTTYSGRNIAIYKNYEQYRNPTVYASWYSVRFEDDPRVSNTDMTVIGGKTGYEDIPTACFVTVAKDKSTNKEYICVVVGRTDTSQPEVSSSTSTVDTAIIYRNYANE